MTQPPSLAQIRGARHNQAHAPLGFLYSCKVTKHQARRHSRQFEVHDTARYTVTNRSEEPRPPPSVALGSQPQIRWYARNCGFYQINQSDGTHNPAIADDPLPAHAATPSHTNAITPICSPQLRMRKMASRHKWALTASNCPTKARSGTSQLTIYQTQPGSQPSPSVSNGRSGA